VKGLGWVVVIEYVYTTGLDRTGRQDRDKEYNELDQIHLTCDSRAHQLTSYILLYERFPMMILLLLEVVLKSKSDVELRDTTWMHSPIDLDGYSEREDIHHS